MSIGLHPEINERVLNVRASGKLAKEDYQRLAPEFEKLIAQQSVRSKRRVT
jgi:hypothetical protein